MATERVVYRTWPNGTVTALFPDSVYRAYVMSYEHIGQHGNADYFFVVSKTRPAQPHEYAELHQELTERVGYVLRIVERARPRRALVEATP